MKADQIRQAIGQVDDADYTEVRVPEWGADFSVRVRTLTGAERDRFLTKQMQTNADGDLEPVLAGFHATIAALVMVDEDGTRVFPDADAGAEQLGQRNADVVQRIAETAMALNGLTAEAVEEEVEGFSEAPSA